MPEQSDMRITTEIQADQAMNIMKLEGAVGNIVGVENVVKVANVFFPLQEEYGVGNINPQMDARFKEGMTFSGFNMHQAEETLRVLRDLKMSRNPYVGDYNRVVPAPKGRTSEFPSTSAAPSETT